MEGLRETFRETYFRGPCRYSFSLVKLLCQFGADDGLALGRGGVCPWKGVWFPLERGVSDLGNGDLTPGKYWALA